MTTETFRVENKSNVHLDGKKTTFTLFQRDGDRFICRGTFAVYGWHASDALCIAAARKTLDTE